jgi:mono/diheme cytochrome c family protein
MGVFAKEDLTSNTPQDGLFDSTVDIKGLIAIENLLRRLAPPKWPESTFGPIDKQKAAAGATLFRENCAECHSVWPHRWSDTKLEGKRFIENALVPVVMVGTDTTHLGSAAFEKTLSDMTGAIGPYLDPPLTGAALAPWPMINQMAQRQITKKILARLGLSPYEIEDARGFRVSTEKPPVQPVYKAGPRDGVWATGPFLHNGSVPNLYEMLVPAGQRSKTFYYGRDFDPTKVGVDTSGASGKFLYDTTLLGNSNAGHSFQDGPWEKGVIGRLLSDEERWDLIEYLKSIPTEDAQVTPFGGPKDPVEAWKDPTFFNVKHSEGYGRN